MPTYKLLLLPGDGIGPEVVAEGLKVLEAVTATAGPKVTSTEYDLGARRWHATGETLPESVLTELGQHDAILLGAIGDPSVPSGVLERGVLLPLRFALEHYVNLRPAKLYPGVESPLAVERVAPGGIDFVVKDGIVYDAKKLLADVAAKVEKAKQTRKPTTTAQ